jgi:hypothetical protein
MTKLVGYVRVLARQKSTDRQNIELAITSRSRHPSSEPAWIVG